MNFTTKIFIFMLYIFSLSCYVLAEAQVIDKKLGLSVGMSKAKLEKKFPRGEARTWRPVKDGEWVTYGLPVKGVEVKNMITFHLVDNRLFEWRIDDRQEVAREYLEEFCSQAFIQNHPKIFAAIKNVFEKIPQEVFIAVTDRKRPVLISEYHTKGIGRYASSSEIISLADDPPAMQNGLTLLKLTTELEETQEPRAIEGIVAHELAHRYLEHFKRKPYSCKLEKEANHLIQDWGFKEEFKLASKNFGAHTEGQVNECNE